MRWPLLSLSRPDAQLLVLGLVGCGLGLSGCDGPTAPAEPMQEGLIYHDADGNGFRNDREKGLARVVVSNGRDVVLTDVRGRWLLPAHGPRRAFAIAPRHWREVPTQQEHTIAMDHWKPEAPFALHVGKVIQHAPDPALLLDGHGDVPKDTLVMERPSQLPAAVNVGDLHVVLVGSALTEDDRRFLREQLEHAGVGRPKVLIHDGPKGSFDLADLNLHNTAVLSWDQAPFGVWVTDEYGVYVKFVD